VPRKWPFAENVTGKAALLGEEGIDLRDGGIEPEDVPVAVELRDGDPVSELSQAGVAATSGAAVAMVV
jgi:hypothetical protein